MAWMDILTEKTWTRWENETGIVDAVARTASRSLRRERRRVDSSVDAETVLILVCVSLGWGRAAGGFFVASPDALVGRDDHAASKSSEWRAQNAMYRSTILEK